MGILDTFTEFGDNWEFGVLEIVWRDSLGAQVFDSQVVERALGWRAFTIRQEEIEQVLSENEMRAIIKLRGGRSVYLLKRIPCLSGEEATLIAAAIDDYMERRHKRHVSATEAFAAFAREQNISSQKEQMEYLSQAISRVVGQAGILSEVLEHEGLEEIAVIGLGQAKPVHVYDSSFGWLPTNLYFSREREIRNIVNAVAGKIGRRITLRSPGINAFLEDGSRLNALMEPASVSGPAVTIRKFRKSPFTPSELAQKGACSFGQLAFLWMAMQADCSALVCGNTGSGKTTLLNSLFNFVPANDRVVIVEETPEICIPHRHTIRTATCQGIEIGMGELIVNTLRMRPDRVIVGEVRRQDEVAAFIDTLLAVQGKGSYGTFHAQSSQEAIARMRSLGALESDLCALDLILVQKRWSSFANGTAREERRLIEISEPAAAAQSGSARQQGNVRARKLFSYDFATQKFRADGLGGRACEKICRSFGISRKMLLAEMARRAKFLEGLAGMGQGEFFNAVSAYGKRT